jgi:cysteinyl-tRNA synthetase
MPQEDGLKMLSLYNTQSRKKEEFKPLNPPAVKMYCCGPTVYDLLHVGNFRGAIFYNFLRQWLEHSGYQVTMIYNYTDVDDRIIARSLKDKTSASEVADKYVKEFEVDFARLKLNPHTANPKVSQCMDGIKVMIAELIAKEKAYQVKNGDVWFSIKAFPEYGKLSNRNPEELQSAVRIEKDDNKKDPLDFALWKHAKAGEPSWESPWGAGRPGWHIECSAMAKQYLGEQIDIHGGGLDLMFPHHENEIAQSEGCSGKTFAKYWVHNNLINFGGAKMSKSLGNVMTARSFMDTYNPEILKYMMLSVHYRSVSDLSEKAIDQAIRGLARIYSSLAVAEKVLKAAPGGAASDAAFEKITKDAWTGIEEAFNDDLNTPEAFARVFEVIRHWNSQVKLGMKMTPVIVGKAKVFRDFLHKFGGLLSLFQESAEGFLIALDDMLLKSLNLSRQEIEVVIQERVAVRAAKDFKRSDELREKLMKMGVAVMDTPEGTFWEVAK